MKLSFISPYIPHGDRVMSLAAADALRAVASYFKNDRAGICAQFQIDKR